MLPLQITLEGFMSYRDAVTLSFEGASLWMLAGNNGAGKSSVFDAMRWMLFNRHRGGAQGHEALIHHDKNKLRVAFDLEIASGRFRLMRTLARGGKSSWQIERLLDDASEKVPETDMRDGYNRWIAENIGLSDETFGAAFYLAQGRGDAILSARPEERYEMLAEIVDLTAFQRLHESARAKAVELESQMRLQRLQFEAAPEVETEEIGVQRQNLEDLTRQHKEFQSQIVQLNALEPWAAQWQQLKNESHQLEKDLNSARELLGDAPQIERDAARLAELEDVLPPLESWLAQRTRVAQNRAQLEKASAQVEQAQFNLESLARDLEVAREQRDVLENERQAHETARLEALTRQTEMAPLLAQAQALETGQARVAQLENQQRQLPTDLDLQKSALETRITTAKQTQTALAVLRRFDRERQMWRRAAQETKIAAQQQNELENELPNLQDEVEKRAAELGLAKQSWTQALETLAATQARFADALSALQRFDEVKNEPNCHFCGQKLTPAHAAHEEKRLQHELHRAQVEVEVAQTARDAAILVLDATQQGFDVDQHSLDVAQKAWEKMKSARNSGIAAQKHASENAAEALRELQPEFIARFAGPASQHWNPSEVVALLENDFPRDADFDELQKAVASLPREEAELEKVQRQRDAQAKIAAQLEVVHSQIAPLQAHFDDAAVAELRAGAADLKSALELANGALKNLEKPLQNARKVVKNAETKLETAREDATETAQQRAGLEAAQAEKEAALFRLESANLRLQDLFSRDENEVLADFSRWQAEKARLDASGLQARLQGLNLARERVSSLENEAARLESSLRQVPEAARRAPHELREEIASLRREMDEREATRREVELELSRLQRLFDEKQRLQAALLDIETRARQHKTLADLLGPHQLQRFLLREAENGIVDEANAVLDRISSGTLRLELRADDDEVVGARKVAPKVLDVAVYQESGEGTPRAMLPAFLSGSQRFRVAVALALGIGRFATRGQGHSKLESVIIDEGFGSLDKIGRGEMIDELKALGDELKRVILVSHQEEFADAFPNRYLIEHDGVASTARLMVG